MENQPLDLRMQQENTPTNQENFIPKMYSFTSHSGVNNGILKVGIPKLNSSYKPSFGPMNVAKARTSYPVAKTFHSGNYTPYTANMHSAYVPSYGPTRTNQSNTQVAWSVQRGPSVCINQSTSPCTPIGWNPGRSSANEKLFSYELWKIMQNSSNTRPPTQNTGIAMSNLNQIRPVLSVDGEHSARVLEHALQGQPKYDPRVLNNTVQQRPIQCMYKHQGSTFRTKPLQVAGGSKTLPAAADTKTLPVAADTKTLQEAADTNILQEAADTKTSQIRGNPSFDWKPHSMVHPAQRLISMKEYLETHSWNNTMRPRGTSTSSRTVTSSHTEATSPAVAPSCTVARSHAVAPSCTVARSHAVAPSCTVATSHAISSSGTAASSHAVALSGNAATSHALAPSGHAATSHAVASSYTAASSHAVASSHTAALSRALASSCAMALSLTAASSHAVALSCTAASSHAMASSRTAASSHAISSSGTAASSHAISSSRTAATSHAVVSSHTATLSHVKANGNALNQNDYTSLRHADPHIPVMITVDTIQCNVLPDISDNASRVKVAGDSFTIVVSQHQPFSSIRHLSATKPVKHQPEHMDKNNNVSTVLTSIGCANQNRHVNQSLFPSSNTDLHISKDIQLFSHHNTNALHLGKRSTNFVDIQPKPVQSNAHVNKIGPIQWSKNDFNSFISRGDPTRVEGMKSRLNWSTDANNNPMDFGGVYVSHADAFNAYSKEEGYNRNITPDVRRPASTSVYTAMSADQDLTVEI